MHIKLLLNNVLLNNVATDHEDQEHCPAQLYMHGTLIVVIYVPLHGHSSVKVLTNP